jgi:hypothetical protein
LLDLKGNQLFFEHSYFDFILHNYVFAFILYLDFLETFDQFMI